MASITTDIPARLDRLPWSAWHWRVVIALGVSWLLDGLEVTVVGSLGPALQRPDTLGLTAGQIGWAASAYIGGAVLGALYFGRLADKLGRKRMFLVTLVVYLIATVLTAFTWDITSFAFCRFLTGFGIGGEYAAINSAIDELIPARLRGRVDLAINGTFWIGAAMGAGLSIILLDPDFIGAEWGWRIAFGLGGILAFAILLVRRHVPESPRWLLMHGRAEEAETVVREIERQVGVPYEKQRHLAIRPLRSIPWSEVLHVLLVRYRSRAIFGITLMASQAFFYNAIFFTYALVLARFYGVPDERVGYYIFPFAIGNFLGPLLLGHLFDTVGRRFMIATTYSLAGLGLLVTGYAFSQDWLTPVTQALSWSAHLLRRLGGGELRLPHGERNLPARDARDLDLPLLRRRHRARRLPRPAALRRHDRKRQPRRAVRRLRLRRRADDRRRARHALPRRRRRAPPARGGLRAAWLGSRAARLIRTSRPRRKSTS